MVRQETHRVYVQMRDGASSSSPPQSQQSPSKSTASSQKDASSKIRKTTLSAAVRMTEGVPSRHVAAMLRRKFQFTPSNGSNSLRTSTTVAEGGGKDALVLVGTLHHGTSCRLPPCHTTLRDSNNERVPRKRYDHVPFGSDLEFRRRRTNARQERLLRQYVRKDVGQRGVNPFENDSSSNTAFDTKRMNRSVSSPINYPQSPTQPNGQTKSFNHKNRRPTPVHVVKTLQPNDNPLLIYDDMMKCLKRRVNVCWMDFLDTFIETNDDDGEAEEKRYWSVYYEQWGSMSNRMSKQNGTTHLENKQDDEENRQQLRRNKSSSSVVRNAAGLEQLPAFTLKWFFVHNLPLGAVFSPKHKKHLQKKKTTKHDPTTNVVLPAVKENISSPFSSLTNMFQRSSSAESASDDNQNNDADISGSKNSSKMMGTPFSYVDLDGYITPMEDEDDLSTETLSDDDGYEYHGMLDDGNKCADIHIEKLNKNNYSESKEDEVPEVLNAAAKLSFVQNVGDPQKSSFDELLFPSSDMKKLESLIRPAINADGSYGKTMLVQLATSPVALNDNDVKRNFGETRNGENNDSYHRRHPYHNPIVRKQLQLQSQFLSLCARHHQNNGGGVLSGFLLKRSRKDVNVWKRVYCVLLNDNIWCISRNKRISCQKSAEDGFISCARKNDHNYEESMKNECLPGRCEVCASQCIGRYEVIPLKMAQVKELRIVQQYLPVRNVTTMSADKASTNDDKKEVSSTFQTSTCNILPPLLLQIKTDDNGVHYFRAPSREIQLRWVSHLFFTIANLSWRDNGLQACDTLILGEEDAKFRRYAHVYTSLTNNDRNNDKKITGNIGTNTSLVIDPPPKIKGMCRWSISGQGGEVVDLIRFGMLVQEFKAGCRNYEVRYKCLLNHDDRHNSAGRAIQRGDGSLPASVEGTLSRDRQQVDDTLTVCRLWDTAMFMTSQSYFLQATTTTTIINVDIMSKSINKASQSSNDNQMSEELQNGNLAVIRQSLIDFIRSRRRQIKRRMVEESKQEGTADNVVKRDSNKCIHQSNVPSIPDPPPADLFDELLSQLSTLTQTVKHRHIRNGLFGYNKTQQLSLSFST
eukprot:CAMPEP_0194370832 /NCGR_PEP_ID=MMETSP0174-20130528/19185_1 /TAXON_ID=216777 /ORGANISM="Proboscia alata, Strain PI-D3" /LENGTH=1085 /DNA_ID=CAMNT_0039148541 /DNA_START=47 /DNA_END=3304 /DNA_ORIENTATION=-